MKNFKDSIALKALKHSLYDSDLFTTLVTRKPRAYTQAYNMCLKHDELEELKAMKVEATCKEPY